jgi:GAF domain-containing protein
MEPVPETEAALDEFMGCEDTDLRELLRQMGRTAREIAPDCVGLSVGLVEEGLTFTLVATDEETAVLDAAQYLDGGPCVTSQQEGEVTETDVGSLLMDEDRWTVFARASAASGIASSLSLPLMHEGQAIGGINLYGSTPQAFDGHHEELADALGASGLGAVTNADLSFSSRRRAAEAPSRLRESNDMDTALGILAARFEESVDEARERLLQAAARADVAPALVARVLLLLHST